MLKSNQVLCTVCDEVIQKRYTGTHRTRKHSNYRGGDLYVQLEDADDLQPANQGKHTNNNRTKVASSRLQRCKNFIIWLGSYIMVDGVSWLFFFFCLAVVIVAVMLIYSLIYYIYTVYGQATDFWKYVTIPMKDAYQWATTIQFPWKNVTTSFLNTTVSGNATIDAALRHAHYSNKLNEYMAEIITSILQNFQTSLQQKVSAVDSTFAISNYSELTKLINTWIQYSKSKENDVGQQEFIIGMLNQKTADCMSRFNALIESNALTSSAVITNTINFACKLKPPA